MDNLFRHQSVTAANSYEENFYRKIGANQSTMVNLLLDSNVIIQSNRKKYNLKIVKCGNYYKMYYLDKHQVYSDKGYEKEYIFDKQDIKVNFHHDKEPPKIKTISKDNLTKTRNTLTNLIKANEHEFKTFITLTFDSKKINININDITECNSKFNIWKTYIKQLFKDFKYIAVPEFQKRGAVHYHLLTNIEYDSKLLTTERKIWSNKSKSYKIGKDVVGWSYGYTMAMNMTDYNVISYLTKYLQKDVDDRLFGQRKFFHSRNLIKPTTYYLDTENMRFRELEEILKTDKMKVVYESTYLNPYDNLIHFIELYSETC